MLHNKTEMLLLLPFFSCTKENIHVSKIIDIILNEYKYIYKLEFSIEIFIHAR